MMQFLQHVLAVRSRSRFLYLRPILFISLFTAYFSGVLVEKNDVPPRLVAGLSTGTSPVDDRLDEAPSSTTHHKFLERRNRQDQGVDRSIGREAGVLDHSPEVVLVDLETGAGGAEPAPTGVAVLAAQQVESDRFYSEVRAVKRTESDAAEQSKSFLQPRRIEDADDVQQHDGATASQSWALQQHRDHAEHDIARGHEEQRHLTQQEADDIFLDKVGVDTEQPVELRNHEQNEHRNAEMVLSPDGVKNIINVCSSVIEL